MNQAELDVVIEKHKKWLRGEGGERADLSYANLRGADLRYANLRYANLRSANLSYANLRSADLSYVDLSCLNLSNADLNGANLRNANLRYVDLRGANLRGADLRGADLSYANLRNVNLKSAILNLVNWQNVFGLTVIAVQVNTTRENNQITYIKELEIWTTGCFQGTLEELQHSIEQTHASNDFLKRRYYRAINYILTEADVDEDLKEKEE